MNIDTEKFEQTYQLAAEKINDARKELNNDNPDPLEIAKIDMELTTMMASIGQIFRTFESESNKFKQLAGDIKEVVRSCRRVHETLQAERDAVRFSKQMT